MAPSSNTSNWADLIALGSVELAAEANFVGLFVCAPTVRDSKKSGPPRAGSLLRRFVIPTPLGANEGRFWGDLVSRSCTLGLITSATAMLVHGPLGCSGVG